MNRRKLIALGTGALLFVVVVTGAAWYLSRKASSSSTTPHGRWVHLTTAASGQPTPTLPPGTLLFKSVTGATIAYLPPTDPPAQITWQTFHNAQDGYTVDYPDGWVKVETTVDGRQGLALFPPNTNPSTMQPGGAEGIGISWTSQEVTPASDDPSVAGVQSITVSGVEGEVFTQGSLDASITALFPIHGGTLVLSADAGTDLLLYVFEHMLHSLRFG